MRFLKGAYKVLSSKELLLWLIGGWVIYYVTSAFIYKEAFAKFAEGLGKNPLIQALFIVFLLCLYMNIARLFSGRLGDGEKILAFFHVAIYIGIALFITGFFVSASSRNIAIRVVGEGEIIEVRWLERAYSIKEIKASLREETLDIDEEKGIFKYEPKILISDGIRDYEVGAYPPRLVNNTYFSILNFGLAPGVRLLKGSEVLDEGYMPLRIIPPGAMDNFKIEPYPYKFTVRIAPSRIIEKGALRAKLYNFNDLSYEVEVTRGEAVLFTGNSKEGVSFDGLSLSFFKPAYWVMLWVVRDWGYPVMIAGIMVFVVGVPLKFLPFVIGRRRA